VDAKVSYIQAVKYRLWRETNTISDQAVTEAHRIKDKALEDMKRLASQERVANAVNPVAEWEAVLNEMDRVQAKAKNDLDAVAAKLDRDTQAVAEKLAKLLEVVQ
jgi:hypothetical protein